MKKVVITIYGKNYKQLSEAAEHASQMLHGGTPSESIEWEDKSRVQFDVQEDAAEEYQALYGDQQE